MLGHTLSLAIVLAGRAASGHDYPGCYLGQIAGPGFVSFDNCAGAGDHFVCKDSATCRLDRCGGFQHLACSCMECHTQQTTAMAPSGASKAKGKSVGVDDDRDSFRCGCTGPPNWGCWCDKAPPPPPPPPRRK